MCYKALLSVCSCSNPRQMRTAGFFNSIFHGSTAGIADVLKNMAKYFHFNQSCQQSWRQHTVHIRTVYYEQVYLRLWRQIDRVLLFMWVNWWACPDRLADMWKRCGRNKNVCLMNFSEMAKQNSQTKKIHTGLTKLLTFYNFSSGFFYIFLCVCVF